MKAGTQVKEQVYNLHHMGIQEQTGWRWHCYEEQSKTGCKRVFSGRRNRL